MLPIISIVGPSDSGKTTLVVKLLRALKRKGYRTGVLKHTHAAIKLDRAGTDTDRFRKAGAALSAISDDNLLASFGDISSKTLKSIFGMLASGLDLLIVEGYKQETLPKLLFTDHLAHVDFKGIVATYGSVAGKMGKRAKGRQDRHIPHFKPSGISSLAAWLEQTFILPGRKTGAVRVSIDGRELPMKPFVAGMIKETNRGLLKSLKRAQGRQIQIIIDFGRKI